MVTILDLKKLNEPQQMNVLNFLKCRTKTRHNVEKLEKPNGKFSFRQINSFMPQSFETKLFISINSKSKHIQPLPHDFYFRQLLCKVFFYTLLSFSPVSYVTSFQLFLPQCFFFYFILKLPTFDIKFFATKAKRR